MAFPPKKGNKNPTPPPQVVDVGPVSNGSGGIPASLKVKAAGTQPAPGAGPDKNVNSF